MKKQGTILIIEDDELIRMATSECLSDRYLVREAKDGKEGLGLFRSQNPDVVLLDLVLPEMTGFEVLASIRQESADIPVIMTTGLVGREELVKAIRFGAWDYLIKPFSLEELRLTVDKAMERGLLVREKIRHYQHLEEEVQKQAALLEAQKQAEIRLQEAHDLLEQRVRERTMELWATNTALTWETGERRRMERELKRELMISQALAIAIQRKKDEKAINVAMQVAEEAKGVKHSFLANMSHEVRTSMNVIIGMTDLTLDTKLDHEQRRYLQMVKESSQALLTLLNDILDLSKIEASHLDLAEQTVPEVKVVSDAAIVPLSVLLVEDDPFNRELARLVLGRAGHQVSLAENGLEALDILAQQDFDAVLMDVEMPGIDGRVATRAIRQAELGEFMEDTIDPGSFVQLRKRRYGAHLPIVAMTAHAMVGDREKILAAGMDDYLTKPFRPADVLGVLGRMQCGARTKECGLGPPLEKATVDAIS